MLLCYCAALLITGCAFNIAYCSKQTGSSSTKGNHHPSFLRFWNWAEETVDAAKICNRRRKMLKQKPCANIRKWIARFYYFRHLYSAGSACVLLTIIAELPIDMGNSICTAH